MKNIVIIQYSPIENYPPVMNFLNDLASSDLSDCKVTVISTNATRHTTFTPNSKQIEIVRIGEMSQSKNFSIRYFGYLLFYIKATLKICTLKPEKIMYYEALAVLPAFLYYRFKNKKTQILAHYHEYLSPAEHKKEMKLQKWMRPMEKRLLEKAHWVSHTNLNRLNLFKNDYNIQNTQLFILPNYPPKWFFREMPGNNSSILKFVYIGSFSSATMFAKEFSQWIAGRLNVEWHIYPIEIAESDNIYFKELGAANIFIHDTVSYFQLPETLIKYDVGIIMYKGHIPNFVFNETNKLYEYLACGLKVIFPLQLKNIDSLIEQKTISNTFRIDFNDIENAMEKIMARLHADSGFVQLKDSASAHQPLIKALLA